METIFQSIEILSKEKGIDPQIVFDAVKDAMLIAARKHYRTNEDYVADMDPKTGAIQLFAIKKAVEAVEDPAHEMTLAEARRIDPAAEVGAEIRIAKKTDALGRISAQTAKQVIFQKVREAERETVYNEYSGRAGELVNCTIKRVEGPDYVLDLGKTEARLPKKEQSRLESYSVGDRVRCVIKLVDKASQRPRASWFRAPRRNWSCACSNRKYLRFTTARFRFAAARAKPANEPRSQCRAATAMWIASAPASA